MTDGKPADTNNQPIFILQAQFVVHRYLVSKPALASGPSIDCMHGTGRKCKTLSNINHGIVYNFERNLNYLLRRNEAKG